MYTSVDGDVSTDNENRHEEHDNEKQIDDDVDQRRRRYVSTDDAKRDEEHDNEQLSDDAVHQC